MGHRMVRARRCRPLVETCTERSRSVSRNQPAAKVRVPRIAPCLNPDLEDIGEI